MGDTALKEPSYNWLLVMGFLIGIALGVALALIKLR